MIIQISTFRINSEHLSGGEQVFIKRLATKRTLAPKDEKFIRAMAGRGNIANVKS